MNSPTFKGAGKGYGQHMVNQTPVYSKKRKKKKRKSK
jgi:hypothetical protein